jgi:hypothetical protein
MKRLTLLLFFIAVATISMAKDVAHLRNEFVEVAVDKNGNLTKLVNLKTGHNYASGG